MRITDIMKRLDIEQKEFVTSAELKEYCKQGNFQYDNAIKYLEEQKHLLRIFRGIFYVMPFYHAEHQKYNHLELVAKGLDLKGVKNWYCGLHTALKFNNMTHEYFTIDDIISDSIFRQKPMTINDHKFQFVKISKNLFNFGIIKHGLINYSDPEKTILDFIYLGKYNGKQDKRIISDVFDWTQKISADKIKNYLKYYPKSVRKIVDEINYERKINQ